MSEYAGYALEETIDYEGLMLDLDNPLDAYEAGIIDELGRFMHTASYKYSKTCRCCNQTGLSWGQFNDKWRLFENGKLHECKVNPLNE